jgi:hypothetical protein
MLTHKQFRMRLVRELIQSYRDDAETSVQEAKKSAAKKG